MNITPLTRYNLAENNLITIEECRTMLDNFISSSCMNNSLMPYAVNFMFFALILVLLKTKYSNKIDKVVLVMLIYNVIRMLILAN